MQVQNDALFKQFQMAGICHGDFQTMSHSMSMTAASYQPPEQTCMAASASAPAHLSCKKALVSVHVVALRHDDSNTLRVELRSSSTTNHLQNLIEEGSDAVMSSTCARSAAGSL